MQKLEKRDTYTSTVCNCDSLIKIEYESCYDFYRLIYCLSRFLDECEIRFINNKMMIKSIDGCKICLINIIKKNYNISNELNISLDLNDFATILKNPKNDKKKLIIDFGKKHITIFKLTGTNENLTKKVLNTLEIKNEDIPLENLNKIDYPNVIIIERQYLDGFFKESGVYSDVIGIKIDSNCLFFSEIGEIGNSEFIVDKNNLEGLISQNITIGNYSLVFLNNLKPLLRILDKQDTIKISLKQDYPLKIEIYFESLDSTLTVYLAPRVEEIDYEEESILILKKNKIKKKSPLDIKREKRRQGVQAIERDLKRSLTKMEQYLYDKGEFINQGYLVKHSRDSYKNIKNKKEVKNMIMVKNNFGELFEEYKGLKQKYYRITERINKREEKIRELERGLII